MNKKIIALLLVLALTLGMAACTKDSNKEVSAYSKGLDANGYFEGVTAKDYVTLGQYEGISVPATAVEVTQDEVEYQISSLLSNYTETREVTDRAARLGDSVDIDYAGYLDGEQFEGGTGNNPSLVLGSGSFIDGFEDGIVGHNVGDNFDLDLTFPESYGNEELAGKAVTFIVTLNAISETVEPELSDSFVAEKLQEEYGWTTVAEMRVGVEDDLKEDALYEYVLAEIDNFEVSEVPEAMVEYEAGCMKAYYEMMASSYGMEMSDLVAAFGYESMEELTEAYREDLVASARQLLVYQAIAQDKGMTVSDKDVEAEFEGMDKDNVKEIKDYYGLPYIKCMVMSSKVAQLIRDSAVIE